MNQGAQMWREMLEQAYARERATSAALMAALARAREAEERHETSLKPHLYEGDNWPYTICKVCGATGMDWRHVTVTVATPDPLPSADDVLGILADCICPDENTRIGNCPRHGIPGWATPAPAKDGETG